MSEGPIRRGELISPSGVGAMVMTRRGVSVIIAGLDHWFPGNEEEGFNLSEFVVQDLRLEMRLGVQYFLLPPDLRRPRRGQPNNNTGLTIPVLRFPEFHVCNSCRVLQHIETKDCGKLKCRKCNRGFLEQVPVVAVCQNGHLQDFPWREWVHQGGNTACNGDLVLSKSGSLGLGAQYVSCKGCKVPSRSLAGVLGSLETTTALEAKLDRGRKPTESEKQTHCRGKRPWVGGFGISGDCDRPLQATLRTSGNVYFGLQESSLFLPEAQDPAQAVEEMRQLLAEDVDLQARAHIAEAIGEDPVNVLRLKAPVALKGFSDDAIRRALNCLSTLEENPTTQDQWLSTLRGREYKTLATDQVYPAGQSSAPQVLRVVPTNVNDHSPLLTKSFKRINLVPKLRETRAMSGFSRAVSNAAMPIDYRKRLMWAERVGPWLPATVVFGEGFFVEFDRTALDGWKESNKEEIKKRIDVLTAAHEAVVNEGRAKPRDITPEFVLAHTLAHLLINQLVYECGYQSAALRERLYVQTGNGAVAFLIYTADGDSDGTMGGLVRLAKPENLGRIFDSALSAASWCSSDPVCQEVGRRGQGPDSCNLAACHSCAMVPETTCENFNKLLDRALLIGTIENPGLGFFSAFSS
jgi:hypothetical protein